MKLECRWSRLDICTQSGPGVAPTTRVPAVSWDFFCLSSNHSSALVRQQRPVEVTKNKQETDRAKTHSQKKRPTETPTSKHCSAPPGNGSRTININSHVSLFPHVACQNPLRSHNGTKDEQGRSNNKSHVLVVRRAL